MEILVVHNDYGRYSGEEAAVDRQIAELQSEGHQVHTLRLTSVGSRDTAVGKVRGFFAGIYSFRGRRMMRKALHRLHPQRIYIHNLYPFLSPWVLPICRRWYASSLLAENVNFSQKAQKNKNENEKHVVMTVHNYRLICPTGLFLRDNRPCELCLQRHNEWGCILHNCEGNCFRSVGYALRNMVARIFRLYLKNIDQYECLTEFQRGKLIEAGFPADRISVKNENGFCCVPTVAKKNSPVEMNGYVGYVGRLSAEKGWDLLLEVAHRHPEIEFRFAGEWREGEAEAHGFADGKMPCNVVICGKLDKEELDTFYDEARFIVAPSRCYEGFPMVIMEAFAHGKRCIAPNHGAFPEVIARYDKLGSLLFNPLDVDDLESKVMEAWKTTNRE